VDPREIRVPRVHQDLQANQGHLEHLGSLGVRAHKVSQETLVLQDLLVLWGQVVHRDRPGQEVMTEQQEPLVIKVLLELVVRQGIMVNQEHQETRELLDPLVLWTHWSTRS